MDSFIQLLSFLASFLYGIIFYLLTKFNYFILDNKKGIVKFIITLVFIIDIVILYIYVMYRINNGYFHIYFVILVILGFILMHKLYKYLQMLCKSCVNKIKIK